MILQDLKLPSRSNQHWQFSGIDHIDHCNDKKHFVSYPYEIDYCYNSRGFRDQEWPDSLEELKNAVWCVGDSYTVGLGSPLGHTWPSRLSVASNRRIINVSMDGASNEWIASTVEKIVNEVNPASIVIMWSYTHRRQKPSMSLNDEDRRLHAIPSSTIDDWENFLDCKKRVDRCVNAVQFAIPYFHPELWPISECWNSIRGPDWPVNIPGTTHELKLLPGWILDEMKNLHRCLDKIQSALTFQHTVQEHNVILVEPLDLARDACHFDLLTAEWVAEQAATRLN